MIDLHLHTTCSDGDYSPSELVNMAANSGVHTISITDHDTVTAYDGNIISYASSKGVLLITGIEFSTIDDNTGEKIHVLGYDIDTNNEYLRYVCSQILNSRNEMVQKTADKLETIGVILRAKKLLDSGSIITKTQIANDVISNPQNSDYFMERYGKLPLQSTFIEDFLIKDKPANIQMGQNLSTSMAIDIIKHSGGKSVCAHPSFNIMQKTANFDDMKKLIIHNGFDGVEAINIQYDKRNGDTRFDMVSDFTKFANDYDLIITGGSDFHSDINPKLGNYSHLGLTNEQHRVTNENVDRIRSVNCIKL